MTFDEIFIALKEGKSPNQAQQSWRDQYAEIMKKSKYKYEILAEENEQEENKVVN